MRFAKVNCSSLEKRRLPVPAGIRLFYIPRWGNVEFAVGKFPNNLVKPNFRP